MFSAAFLSNSRLHFQQFKHQSDSNFYHSPLMIREAYLTPLFDIFYDFIVFSLDLIHI